MVTKTAKIAIKMAKISLTCNEKGVHISILFIKLHKKPQMKQRSPYIYTNYDMWYLLPHISTFVSFVAFFENCNYKKKTKCENTFCKHFGNFTVFSLKRLRV